MYRKGRYKMKSKGSMTREEDWLRAIWDMTADMRTTIGYGFQLTLTPAKQRGVFMGRVRACNVVDGRLTNVVAQVEFHYPTSEAITLSIAISKALHELDRLIAEDILNNI
jgi:hypothetical protein